MIKVSVIVPVYNVEQYIGSCVNSILNQSLEDIEIILVNDGSPDRCPEICDQFSESDIRIKVIHKPNGGVSAARNDGLKAASGEYVIFCDSDDWMEANALELLYQKAISTNSDIVIGDVYMARKSGNSYVKFYRDEFVTSDQEFIIELIKADIYRTYCPCPAEGGPAFGYGGPWNKLVRKQLLDENKVSFDLRVKGIFDDILYTAYILSYAGRIAYIQKPVYYYRIVESSITHTYKPNVVEINDAIFNSWDEFFKKSGGGFDVYREAFSACIMRRLEEAIKLYYLNSKNDKDQKTLKRELKALISSEPYYSAVREVNLRKISKKQKLLSFLARLNAISVIYYIRGFWMS